MVSFGIAVSLSLVLAFLGLLYAYVRKKLSYWEERNVPSEKSTAFIGNFLAMYRKPLHELEVERLRKHGRVYGVFEGLKPHIVIADPTLLRSVYVKDFHIFNNRRDFKFNEPLLDNMISMMRGEEWKRVRSVVSPTFSGSKMRKMILLIKDCASSLVENFEECSSNDVEVNCKELYAAFGMDAFARCAFGTKIDSHKDPENPFLKNAKVLTSQQLTLRAILQFVFPVLLKISRTNIFPKHALEYFRDAALHIIEQRKKNNEKHNDFLQLLLDAKEGTLDVADEKEDNAEEKPPLQHIPKTKTITEDEMLAQCVIFLMAGSDGIAHTLTYATYYLAKNPDIQERLIKEVDETWETQGSLNYDGVMKMKYLDAVINETLRINSVALRGERSCGEDYKLGDTGIVLPKGTVIGIPIYAMHHDPEWFPEPEKFDPERFLVEDRTFPPYSFVPFGEGPRNCIAMRFSLMLMKACLFYLLRHIRFVASEKTKLEYEFSFFLLRAKHMFVKIEPRTDVK